MKGWKLRFVELSAPNPSKDVVNQLLNDVVSRTQGPLVESSFGLSVEHQKKGKLQYKIGIILNVCIVTMTIQMLNATGSYWLSKIKS